MPPDRVLAASILCCALLPVACCGTSPPAAIRPDPVGLLEQRALIAREFSGVDPRAASLVERQPADRVSAAWWGFDPSNATDSLQAGLDSGARVVLVPSMGTPWVTGPLTVRSGTTLVLEEGAELVSLAGAFRGGDESLLELRDAQDVTIMGYGARLAMRKGDYRRKPYEKSEWRHAIELYGCSNVRILGLRAESSGGDGVYLGSGDQAYNRGILLKDLELRDHYRQGISVISAEDLRIENVEMAGTEGTPPSAGIDFEPNSPAERLVRCVVVGCIIRGNRGPGISVVLGKLDRTSRDVDIRFEDTSVSNSLVSFLLWGAWDVRGKVQLVRTSLGGIPIIGTGQQVAVIRE